MRLPARLILLTALVVLPACAHRGPVMVPTEPTKPRDKGWTEKGDASWYGKPYHGRTTASGETYDMYAMTAAHRSLPFGTQVRVERQDTGARVEVRINDRGPFIKGRIIDLSLSAARVIGLDIDGVAPVKLKVIGTARKSRKKAKSKKQPPRAQASRCFWVQVGAFGDGGNAQRAKESLTIQGERALVIEGPDGFDRVRVGPFDTEKEARAARDRLLGEWPPAQVVECGG